MEGIIEKSSSNHKLVLDNYCKLIICHEEILSRIVKCFIDEAKHLTLNEIERLIKEKKSFQHLDKENFIPYSGKTNYDFLCTIDLSQRIYLNIEIQNDPNPGYSLITRGLTYISRIMTTQWKNEYYDYDYNHIKKVYSIWILPQSAKKNDGHINAYKIDEININGTTIERIETYDKGVLIMIYLNKEHDTNEKYIIYDNILTPLVAFLNNVLSYQEKRKIIEQLGGKRCIAVGNGRNDLPMCRIAELSVGIIEAEGAYGRLIANVDICTRSIEEALDVLAMPKRMVATLRG
jgi:hydroxymethylpyrimidine pyrophosphatase-like HAD family hydrolase